MNSPRQRTFYGSRKVLFTLWGIAIFVLIGGLAFGEALAIPSAVFWAAVALIYRRVKSR